jgi:pimeloyl-ACP methyl ester carboxylesterase
MRSQVVELQRPATRIEELVRFVDTHDGARLWTRSLGVAGRPTIVLLDGLGCDGYVWKYILEWFAPSYRIVHWHYRGHGKSDAPRSFDDVSLDEVMRDLVTVLDETGVDRAILMGHSMGVQVALEAFARHRERVAGLVLLFGSYEHPIDSWHGAPTKNDGMRASNLAMRAGFGTLSRQMTKHGHLITPLWRRVIETHAAYEIATRTEVDGQKLARKDFAPYLTHLANMDPRVFFAFARALSRHSAKDVLSRIDVPTLVVGGGRDTFTPLWRSTEMGHRIPASDLLLIDDATHSGPLEHPTRINERIARHLRTHGARF